MRVLDLFSGIGAFSLGLERAGMRTISFCEIDPFCRRVLAKHWPEVPCYHDVRGLSAQHLTAAGCGDIDLICGGFPCQDLSKSGYAMGQRTGLDGERSGLWRDFARLISEIRPRYAIVENVPDLLYFGLGDVLGDLAEIGYDAEWHCIPASFIGAWHTRDRIWIIAYPFGERVEGRGKAQVLGQSVISGQYSGGFARWEGRSSLPTPRLCGGNDGIAHRVDRTRALGNSLVPQIPELIGRAILAAEAR